MALHEVFAESLGAFQLRGGFGGAEDAQAVGAEVIDHAGGQGLLGANDREADFFGLRPFAQFEQIGDGHVFQLRRAGGAAVAGGHIDLLHFGRAGQPPGQRVFAAAGANNENFHGADSEVGSGVGERGAAEMRRPAVSAARLASLTSSRLGCGQRGGSVL